jgi:Flp pilus assembly pilin Flp
MMLATNETAIIILMAVIAFVMVAIFTGFGGGLENIMRGIFGPLIGIGG